MVQRHADKIGYLTGLAVVILAVILLALHGRQVLHAYSWVLFPGIFVVALIGRLVEVLMRRHRLRRFRN